MCVANDRRAILALAALTCWLALASSAAAQGFLKGVVYHPTGEVAANITVVAEREDTGEIWDTHTNSLGSYTFYNLPIGTYTIRVDQPQRSFIRLGYKLRPDVRNALDFTLCQCELVTVRGTSRRFSRRLSDGSLGVAYSRDEIDAMFKINGEDLQSLLIGVPTINPTDQVGTLAQYTAMGQRRHGNRTIIDGVSADLAIDVAALGLSQAASGTLPAFSTTGGTQTLFSMDAVDEIQIRTTNASSEYARTPGAQTVIVTRSGTDHFKASSRLQLRPDSLAARNWFSNSGARPETRRGFWDSNLTVGGPILPRRLFYFGAWEHQRIDRSVFTTANVPSRALREAVARRPGGSAIASVIAAYPLPNGPELPGGLAELTEWFPANSRSNTFSVRLDATLSNVHRPFVRFSRGTSTGDTVSTAFLPSYSFATTEATETETTTVGLSSAWRSVTHDLRANISIHEGSVVAGPARLPGAQSLLHTQFVAPGVSASDALIGLQLPFVGGPLLFGSFGRNAQKQLQIADTWSFVLGRHEWRLGLEFQQLTASIDPARHRYNYRFASLDELVQGLVRFTNLQDALPASVRREAWSLFATDTFRVSPRLSLNFGLRYSVKPAPFSRNDSHPYLFDFNSLTPDELPTRQDGPLWDTSWSDIAPRIALTYQIRSKAGWETSVRGGASLIFDDRSSSGIAAFGGGYGYTASRSFPNSPFPVLGNNLTIPPVVQFSEGDLSTYYSFPKDLRTPRTLEWQFGVDQNLGRLQQLSLAYAGAAGRDLIYWHTYDFGTPQVHAYSNDARSDYHALLVEYTRRLSRGLQGSVSYTWSHSIDNDSGEASRGYAPPQLLSPSLNRASADFDRRHVLRMVGSYQVPSLKGPRWLRQLCENWRVDAVLTAQTATPFSIFYLKNFDFGTYFARPDILDSVPLWTTNSSSPGGRSINSSAFVVPKESRQGTLGRNTLRAFPLRQTDLSLSRQIRLGERLVAHLRVDAFNVLNTPHFGPPNASLLVDNFGVPDRSYAEGLGTGTLLSGGLTPIQQLGGARSLQLGVRFSY